MPLTPLTPNDYPAPKPADSPGADTQYAGLSFEEKLDTLIPTMIRDAQSFIEQEFAPDRAKAIRYYNGEPYGDEEEGRSQVRTTDVRDAIRTVMPTLLRLFTGPNRYVEYAPRGKDDERVARQRTEYVNYCLNDSPNNAFLLFHSWFKDALRGIGFVKWWWDDAEEVEEADYTGLTPDLFEVLLADDEVEITNVETREPEREGEPPLTDCHVRRVTSRGRLRTSPVPSEEILWDRNARNFRDARCVVHTRELFVSDLVAMGYDLDTILDLAGPSEYHHRAEEIEARTLRHGGNQDAETPQDPMTRPVRYAEAYVYLENPEDEQGRARLYKVCTVGDQFRVIDHEPVSHRPIAYLICDPEPHTVGGLSYADDTMDLQRISSAIFRGLLDSLALAINPRTEAVENQVNLRDLMNTEIGAIVRTRAPGMVREITHRFVGGDIQPAFDVVAEMKETRLGQSRAGIGLDADALQSATKMAVAGTFSKAQERSEMLARIFAETGVKDMYRGVLRTIIEHQDYRRTVRLRGMWAEVDPRAWNANMDVVVNVALGGGMFEEKQQNLNEIIGKMEAILQAYGPHNPLVTFTQYRNALARAIELVGYPNPDEFFQPITPESEAQWQQAAQQAAQQQQPQDSGAQQLAQIEMGRLQLDAKRAEADAQIRQIEQARKDRELMLLDDRERDKIASDRVLRLQEMRLKYHSDLSTAVIDAEVESERARLDADVARNAQRAEPTQQAEPPQAPPEGPPA